MFEEESSRGNEEKEPVATDGYTGPFSPWSGQQRTGKFYTSAGVELVDVTFPGQVGIWTYQI